MEERTHSAPCPQPACAGGAHPEKAPMRRALPRHAPRAAFLATAEAGDEEMAARIARHRAEQRQGWITLEEPLEVAGALAAEARPGRVVVVDCLTLWLSNLMLAGRDRGSNRPAREGDGDLAGPVILMSNGVGLGIVPEDGLGRSFATGRDGRTGDRRGLRRGGVHRRRPSGPVEAPPALNLTLG